MTSLSAEMTSSQYSCYEHVTSTCVYVCERGGGEGKGESETEGDNLVHFTGAMHRVESKGAVLVSWVVSVVTMVARGAAKKMIVKKLQTSPS